MPLSKRTLRIYSRELRSNMTPAEKRLWHRIRHDQLGFRFNRQKIILGYIVDFYCAKAKLVIELDGSQHYTTKQQQKDKTRDTNLAALGITVLRFDNYQVMTTLDEVIEEIYQYLSQRN
ncbi:hypothetical protein QV01_03455 [Gallibacterium genomosp. 3]|uniref:DUF559 domain-containing protein n=1 Tax=Gallibacterium genomosp. 3 TaxID=505345 RepID=A0A1A7NS27_9PAST|nr:endonuclease domain-containing protein [Gallibacterium genomosp. 3]OBW93032.1 hypothetical protein QV01_03455 [Gallibacterium genomosp. 3]